MFAHGLGNSVCELLGGSVSDFNSEKKSQHRGVLSEEGTKRQYRKGNQNSFHNDMMPSFGVMWGQ